MLKSQESDGRLSSLVDISQSRLDFAKKLGADHVILADTKDGQEMAVRVKDAMGGMPEITIECSGAESAIQLAIYVRKDMAVFMVERFCKINKPSNLKLKDVHWNLVPLKTFDR